jgi:hypothetical protein
MNALKISWLCPFILSMSAAAQISVSLPTDPEQRGYIERVMAIPVSQLDQNLPDVSLQDWLLAEAGPDAKIAWYPESIITQLNDTGDPYRDCGLVYAYATTWDGREFFVKIGVGGTCGAPVFDMGGMMAASKKEGGALIRRLSDLPRLRWANPKKVSRTEG